MTVVSPGAASAGEQHRRLDLRRRHRRAVDDRDRIARAFDGDREPAAFGHVGRPRAHQHHRIEDALHRPFAQRGVAVEGGRDRAACRRAHDQPAAGGGIAEIEHPLRLPEAADPDAMHAPGALAGALDLRPQRPHGLAGVKHVLAFEKPGNPGLPDRQRAENQRAMRDRLVAGHAQAALERGAGAGGKRGLDGGVAHGDPH